MGFLRAPVLVLAALFALDFPGTDAFLPSGGLSGAVRFSGAARCRVLQPKTAERRAPPQRAVLRMSAAEGGGGDAPEEPEVAGVGKKEEMVEVRKGDVEVVLEMARAEEKDGNSTGAAAYRGIAERMENLMSRSTARMTSSLKLNPEPGSPLEADVVWPYLDSSLTAVLLNPQP